jgi:hypothetical protein
MKFVDLDTWFRAADIDPHKARQVAQVIESRYPALSCAMKDTFGVEPQLELIKLVFDVQSGQFPTQE